MAKVQLNTIEYQEEYAVKTNIFERAGCVLTGKRWGLFVYAETHTQ